MKYYAFLLDEHELDVAKVAFDSLAEDYEEDGEVDHAARVRAVTEKLSSRPPNEVCDDDTFENIARKIQEAGRDPDVVVPLMGKLIVIHLRDSDVRGTALFVLNAADHAALAASTGVRVQLLRELGAHLQSLVSKHGNSALADELAMAIAGQLQASMPQQQG